MTQIHLIAAARDVSEFAACRDLTDAPFDPTIRNVLEERLPEMVAWETSESAGRGVME
ncbi:MAG: hypothetical protein H6822_35750 [Planctomycetaceae bacterium]|nr:hypothetical protein [Planctomycetales bacterium]MCB9927544.1 hypothetical protein [Planctomycetaceae bacterium]